MDNERAALRRFGEVYGAVVMVPAAHLEPGVVQAYGTRETGIDRPRALPDAAPTSAVEAIAAGAGRLPASAPACRPEIMRLKYAKLILNLGNAVEALCGPRRRGGER